MSRTLIVNADDFGRSSEINAGIVRAHEQGIVTSASLMVRWPGASEAVRLAREGASLAVGLHLDLGEWRFDGDGWAPTYSVVDVDDESSVLGEVAAQHERFRALVGREPTHVDSHQHVHLHEPAASAAARLAERLGVPLRHRSAVIGYSGDFYGRTREGDPYPDGIKPEQLVRIILRLPEGVTELACHPGDEAVDDPLYGPERAVEVATLCDPRVKAAIEDAGVRLSSFADFGEP